MPKVVKLVYLDTCLPDYFQGFSGHTYSVSIPAKPRSGEVLRGLLDLIRSEEIWLDGDYLPDDAYDKIREQAIALFEDIDKRKSWSKVGDDLSECYIYFGLTYEDGEA